MSRELASQIGLAELGTLRGSSQNGLVEPGSLEGSSQNGLIELGSQDTGPSRLGLGRLAKTGGTLLTLGTVGTVAALSLPLLAGPKLWGFGSGGSGTEESDKDGEKAQTGWGWLKERANAEFPGGTGDKVDKASGSIFGRGSVWRPRT